jgi:hypothetical protein
MQLTKFFFSLKILETSIIIKKIIVNIILAIIFLETFLIFKKEKAEINNIDEFMRKARYNHY